VINEDMAGKPIRAPRRTGRGRLPKGERQSTSRETQDRFWAARLAKTNSPVQALRVLADRATTVALQAERRAAVALEAAKAGGDPAQIKAAEARLTTLQTKLDGEINEVLDRLTSFIEAHQTVRV
jgi:hypothetical protein